MLRDETAGFPANLVMRRTIRSRLFLARAQAGRKDYRKEEELALNNNEKQVVSGWLFGKNRPGGKVAAIAISCNQ